MSTNHYTRKMKDLARELGYAVELSPGGHMKMTHTKTGSIVFAPATPRQPDRTLMNMRAYMRRGAADVVKIMRSGQKSPDKTRVHA